MTGSEDEFVELNEGGDTTALKKRAAPKKTSPKKKTSIRKKTATGEAGSGTLIENAPGRDQGSSSPAKSVAESGVSRAERIDAEMQAADPERRRGSES